MTSKQAILAGFPNLETPTSTKVRRRAHKRFMAAQAAGKNPQTIWDANCPTAYSASDHSISDPFTGETVGNSSHSSAQGSRRGVHGVNTLNDIVTTGDNGRDFRGMIPPTNLKGCK